MSTGSYMSFSLEVEVEVDTVVGMLIDATVDRDNDLGLEQYLREQDII